MAKILGVPETIVCKWCGGLLDEDEGWHLTRQGDQGGYDEDHCELIQLRALRDRLVAIYTSGRLRELSDACIETFVPIIAGAKKLQG